MARVRHTADVEPELKRQVKIAAMNRDTSVSDWIEDAVRRKLEREEPESRWISAASVPAFRRDWDSDEDAVYDELVE